MISNTGLHLHYIIFKPQILLGKIFIFYRIIPPQEQVHYRYREMQLLVFVCSFLVDLEWTIRSRMWLFSVRFISQVYWKILSERFTLSIRVRWFCLLTGMHGSLLLSPARACVHTAGSKGGKGGINDRKEAFCIQHTTSGHCFEICFNIAINSHHVMSLILAYVTSFSKSFC